MGSIWFTHQSVAHPFHPILAHLRRLPPLFDSHMNSITTDERERRFDFEWHDLSTLIPQNMSLSPSPHDSCSIPLLSNSAPHSSAIDINILECCPPPLLDVTPAIRSLIWQYMDNRSAIHYLSACKQLHSLYHSFPLTEPVHYERLLPFLISLRGSESRALKRAVWVLLHTVIHLVLLPIAIFVITPVNLPVAMVILVLINILRCIIPIRDFLLPDRSNCCAEARRLHRLRRQVPVPRVLRLHGTCPVTDAPYLRHAEEMRLCGLEGQSNHRASAAELAANVSHTPA